MSLSRLRSWVSRYRERCEHWICGSQTRHAAETIAYSQKIALTLQVLLGALITALGAALKGPNVRWIQLMPSLYLPDIDASQTS